MSKKSSTIGTQINDAQLGLVQGGVTVYSDEDNKYGVDLKPLVETAKWAWKKIKGWF